MSKYYYIVIVSLLLLVNGCSQETVDAEVKQIDKLILLTPDSYIETSTRVSVIPDNTSLGLICTWQNNDQIHFFGFQNLDYYRTMDMGCLSVENISDDGKRCEFSVKRPDNFDLAAPYTIYGVCGKEAQLVNNKVYVYGNLIRSTLANFEAPVWFKANIGLSWSANVVCQHMGTYELLHIKNYSGQDIVFKWVGFETEYSWYYENVAFLPETNELVENGASVNDKSQAEAVVKIPAGEERILISWFIPNGKKMKDAALLASIDGKEIKSKNKKSSSIIIEVGHAYHFYVNWDGKDLFIDSFSEQGIKFGDIPNHDL